MFRLVADITELNIDQVKLPKIPGLGMLMKLPNKQKISMIVSVLNAQKGQFLPKWQEAVNQKWGQLQLLDYQVEQPGDGSCLARIQIDVGNADTTKRLIRSFRMCFRKRMPIRCSVGIMPDLETCRK